MSERTSFRIHIGEHENSAFTPIKKKQEPSIYEKQLSTKKHAYAYIKALFSTHRILPDIKNK
jgi:hypothetical protein